jgi:lysophospholipase L1-like esterase
MRTATMSPQYRGVLNGRDFSRIPIHTNRLGFRDREYDLDALSRSNPILFLGDSYVFGWGVRREERVSELFAEELRKHAINAPVLNMAVAGTGTYQALDLLKAFGRPLTPRLVILGFFVGNDILDNQVVATIVPDIPAHDSDAVPSLTRVDASERSRALSVRELIRTSPVFNLIKYGLWEFRIFRRLFNRLEIQNDRIALYSDQADDAHSGLYGPTLEALNEIVQLSREAGIPMLFLIIPDHLQVLEPQLFANYDSQKPQRILSQHLATLDIPYLDVLPAFTTAPDPQQLFFLEDKHWSRDGHALVARALVAPAMRILAGGANSAAHGQESTISSPPHH